ncbi:MAG: FkbM family methyltransferase [Alphaproteobacteria bacterium]
MHTDLKYKDETIKVALLEGCSVSDTLAKTHSFHELSFLESLAPYVQAGDWVVDVGAHIGNHSLFFAKTLNVNSLAIEPNPKAFDAIKAGIRLNNIDNQIIPVNRAISNREGDVCLTKRRTGDASSFTISEEAERGGFRCKTATLDSYLKFFEEKNLKLIKVDVQGSEGDVLRTGVRLIEKYKPLIATEVGSVEDFRAHVSFFQACEYVPISIHSDRPAVVWHYENGARAREALLKIFDFGIQRSLTAMNNLHDLQDFQSQYQSLKDKHTALE